MLVLSRKHGERIHIGDDIFIEVRRVSGNRVTLAVNAPKELRVLRGELLEAAKSFEEEESEQNKPTQVSSPPTDTTSGTSQTYMVAPQHLGSHESFSRSHIVS